MHGQSFVELLPRQRPFQTLDGRSQLLGALRGLIASAIFESKSNGEAVDVGSQLGEFRAQDAPV